MTTTLIISNWIFTLLFTAEATVKLVSTFRSATKKHGCSTRLHLTEGALLVHKIPVSPPPLGPGWPGFAAILPRWLEPPGHVRRAHIGDKPRCRADGSGISHQPCYPARDEGVSRRAGDKSLEGG